MNILKISYLLLFLTFSVLADESAHIICSARDLGQTVIAKRLFTLTPIAPASRSISTNLFSKEPKSLQTSTDGVCTFSNVVWGYYRLDLAPNNSWNLLLGTNQSGTVSAAALITNAAAYPPDPATNYYTMAQTDALLDSIEVGSGTPQTNISYVAVTNAPWQWGSENLTNWSAIATTEKTSLTIVQNSMASGSNILSGQTVTATNGFIGTNMWVAIPENGSIVLTNPSVANMGVVISSNAAYFNFGGANSIVVSNGNLLVGTATDSGYKLNVSGTIRSSGGIVSGSDFGMPSSGRVYWSSRNRLKSPADGTLWASDSGDVNSLFAFTNGTFTVNSNIVTAAGGIFIGDSSGLTNGSTSLATNTPSDGQILSATGNRLKWITSSGSGDMLGANNLSDVSNIGTARTNIGALGTNVILYQLSVGNGTSLSNVPYTAIVSAPWGLPQTNISYVAVTNAPWADTNNATEFASTLSVVGNLTAKGTSNYMASVYAPTGSLSSGSVGTLTILNQWNAGLGTNLMATNLVGTAPTARLGSGSADATTYLRGDSTWATISGGGSSNITDAGYSAVVNNLVVKTNLTMTNGTFSVSGGNTNSFGGYNDFTGAVNISSNLNVTGNVTLKGIDVITNTWSANTAIGLGTNFTFTSGATTCGITDVNGASGSEERTAQLTIKSTGDIVFTNPAAFYTSDGEDTRTFTNGNLTIVLVRWIPGFSTNLTYSWSK